MAQFREMTGHQRVISKYNFCLCIKKTKNKKLRKGPRQLFKYPLFPFPYILPHTRLCPIILWTSPSPHKPFFSSSPSPSPVLFFPSQREGRHYARQARKARTSCVHSVLYLHLNDTIAEHLSDDSDSKSLFCETFKAHFEKASFLL